MLNAKAFSDSLHQVLGDGIETAMVIGLSGDLMGCASTAAAGDKTVNAQGLLSAAVTNMWAAYSNNDLSRPQQQAMGDAAATPEGLEVLYATVGEKKVCLFSVGGAAILVLAGQAAVEFGMLKAKGTALQRHLDGPLRTILKQ